MKIGVTGGAGFIGGHIADRLLAEGYEVLVFDHLGRAHDPALEVMLGDVRDATAVTELAAHVDGIVHLAAVLGTQETVGNPWPAAETNVLGTVNVLNACRQYGLPVAYAGVGNFWFRNTYSTTKTAAERLVEQYRDEFGLRAGIVRPCNAYGPRQLAAAPYGPGKVRKIAPAFICRALSGDPIEVYGDGSQVSDMVHVTDVARVFVDTLMCCAAGAVPPLPIEVGPTESCTVADVAREVQRAVSTLGRHAPPIVHLPMRPGERSIPDVDHGVIERIVASTSVIEGELVGSMVRRALKTLGTRVAADTATLGLVGVDPATFVGLADGIESTTRWFAATEGTHWHRPVERVA